jgi:hypothetical protein
MGIKGFLRKYQFINNNLRRFMIFLRNLANLGIFPIKLARITKIPRYMRESIQFKSAGGKKTHLFPILSDYKDFAGNAKGHYFHQDLIVSQYIFKNSPARHIDIGSRIDGFVAHVASYRQIEILDIREMEDIGHPNIKYGKIDLMNNSELEITDSISCLHTIEHFGLGRYGDNLDPNGYLLGFRNILKMLSPGGNLYISFPIGRKNETHFNAHRVFHPTDIFSWQPEMVQLVSFDYVDDRGDFHRNFDVLNKELDVTYGCGIYTFVKL